MKPIFFLLSFLLTACATRSSKAVVTVVPSPSGRALDKREVRSVRYGETIKAYPLGRYVDPTQRGVMHEAHTIYRVESTSKWNLTKPKSSPVVTSSSSPRTDFSRNELLVELNRQREATKAVMQSGESVSTKLTELASSLQRNQQTLAEQNAGIRKELQIARERIETLEQKTGEPPAPKTSPSVKDEPW